MLLKIKNNRDDLQRAPIRKARQRSSQEAQCAWGSLTTSHQGEPQGSRIILCPLPLLQRAVEPWTGCSHWPLLGSSANVVFYRLTHTARFCLPRLRMRRRLSSLPTKSLRGQLSSFNFLQIHFVRSPPGICRYRGRWDFLRKIEGSGNAIILCIEHRTVIIGVTRHGVLIQPDIRLQNLLVAGSPIRSSPAPAPPHPAQGIAQRQYIRRQYIYKESGYLCHITQALWVICVTWAFQFICIAQAFLSMLGYIQFCVLFHAPHVSSVF